MMLINWALVWKVIAPLVPEASLVAVIAVLVTALLSVTAAAMTLYGVPWIK